MIFSQRQVMEGERLPFGYGRAYYLFQQDACVCYPVPFNLIVRWARNFYYWMACPKPTYQERYEGLTKQLDEYRERYWKLEREHAAAVELLVRINQDKQN